MPPKKKKDATKKDEEADAPVKTVTQQPKKQPKEVKDSGAQQNTVQQKKQISKPDEQKPQNIKPSKPESEPHKKINLAEQQKLSEAEILERRRLRFNLVGTQVNAQEAEKLTKQRMQKFGSSKPETKEDLEKRKQKFSSVAPLNLGEDQTTLEKRREKFGGVEAQPVDRALLEERKKKFGSNDINLDDEIQKGKDRQNHRRDNFKRSKPHHHQSRDRYDNKDKRFKR